MHHVDAEKITLPSSGDIIQWANLQKRKKPFNKTKLYQIIKGDFLEWNSFLLDVYVYYMYICKTTVPNINYILYMFIMSEFQLQIK